MTSIQSSGDQKAGFDLEYQEIDASRHFPAKRDFTADKMVKAFVSYSSGSDDWKKVAEWEPIKW